MCQKICVMFFVLFGVGLLHIKAQESCNLNKPIKVNELRGRIFFEYNLNVFSLKMVGISVSKSKTTSPEIEIMPDKDGRFEIKDLKSGKYYLSIESLVGEFSDLEFEIVSNNEKETFDNQIEITFTGMESPCRIKSIKKFNNIFLAGSPAIREWDDISEITLERKGCFGSCPRDKITFRKDSTVIYEGKMFVNNVGMFKGEFWGFEKLAELIYKQNFFNMNERYEIPITDLMTNVISVKQNNQNKSVEIYGNSAPVELWAIQLAIENLIKEIKWKPYLPTSELKNVDLRHIPSIPSKGRVQDMRYTTIRTIEKLTAIGKDSIPFLIKKLDDETKIEHHIKNYWRSMSVGDLALIILDDFFTKKDGLTSTIEGFGWDEFLERGEDRDSTGETILRNYIEKHGRKKIKERWQKFWEENKEHIYWDEEERCFKIKSSIN